MVPIGAGGTGSGGEWKQRKRHRETAATMHHPAAFPDPPHNKFTVPAAYDLSSRE